MMKKNIKDILGCLPKALFGNFMIGAGALLLGIILSGPKIYISLNAAIISFAILLALYLVLTWWSIWALSGGYKNNNLPELVVKGPYALTRNPMYAAIIFILNPALGILFRSWLLILAVIPIYFFWRKCVKEEEQGSLMVKFGESHLAYLKNTPRFFPNFRRVSPFLFYGLVGIFIFSVSFIFLNFNALYLRWVVFETNGKIVYDEPAPQYVPFPSNQAGSTSTSYEPLPSSEPIIGSPDYNTNPNTIIISRINVRAPLIMASGTTQKELNDSLNQGVIIYPGSALPGQNGELVLSGHSSIFPWVKTQYGQVFTLLDKLQAGDTVSIIYNHRQYDYQITKQEILNPNQVKISEINQPALKLTTCWPIGTSAKRLVVYGTLIQ